jgi:uncharacterized protein (TIGR02145 family)
MSLKCKLKAHHWDGCICTVCGTKRNEHHDLKEDCEKCSRCGKEIENNHEWSKDCEICSKCGKTRENEHIWFHDCERCSKCGKTRANMHHFENNLCTQCGHGFYKDDDGKVYNVVKIGEQILMSQNYAKKPNSGNYWCYDNLKDNEVKFGLLYDLETAKTIIPSGWHIPNKGEWESLFNTLGGKGKEKEIYNHLKEGGDSGFECRFGGYRFVRGVFNSLGVSAHFMSNSSEGDSHIWHFKLSAYKHIAEFEKGEKGLGLSLRLFKDK